MKGIVIGVGKKKAKEGVGIPQTVKLEYRKPSVDRGYQEHCHAKVPTVVEQWQETTVQSGQGSNAKDEVQKQEGERGGGANEKRLECHVRVESNAKTYKRAQVA